MNSSPLLSVCLITYNHVSYVREAIESVLSQEVDFSWELIVADDFSTDGTREIILEYQKKNPDRIKLIFQEKNVGAAKNWLDLIYTPKAKYIAYIEGDDYWIDNRKLALQVEFLEKNNLVDIVFHSTMLRQYSDVTLEGPFRVHSSCNKIIAINDVIAGGGGFMPSPSIMVRRSVVDTLPTHILRPAPVGDYILQIYGSIRGGAGYINKPMCVYRVGQSVSWTSSMKNSSKMAQVQSDMYKMVKELERDLNNYNRAFSNFVFYQYSAQLYNAYLRNDNFCLEVCLEVLQDRKKYFSFRKRILVGLISSKLGRRIYYSFRHMVYAVIRMRQRILGR